MALNHGLLAEFDHEVAGTRKTLERVPYTKADWKPHPKSFALAALATHVARLPGWAKEALTQDALDMAAPGSEEWGKLMGSHADLMALFEKNVAAGRAAIAGTSDETFMQPWSLKTGETVHLTMPKIAVLRSFVMNHLIHHRAQLGVYLRMLDVPVPALYGPSADEQGM
jgi:uncharacterized damage-inducible protein DinB